MTFKALLNRAVHHAPRHIWVKPEVRNDLFYIKSKAEANNKRDGRAIFLLG
ncbi:hypothetical protein FIU96_12080 [Marinobacter sp. THAF39]|nr:hypothetical protein FIV08_12165 [Marinobacter sp. THAF197a]QFT51363.1 hypothetical protein FIU96_12080 [Marinobacter sp. THAF39]